VRTRSFGVLILVLGLTQAACRLPAEWAYLLPFAPVITRMVTNTAARSVSATPSTTPTPFLPAENTPVLFPSAAPSETATFTLTSSASPSASPTPSWTLSLIPSLSATASRTRTLTFTPISSRTSTATRTITLTPNPSLSPTITFTPTISHTPTSSYTWTVTWTPSQTPIPSDTYTVTLTPTPSDTLPPSATPTITNTGTATFTPSPSFTASPYLSPTFTVSPSVTATPTPSFTPTATRPGCNPVYNSSYESQIISLINQTRVANGLPELTVSNALMNSAREHSTDMAINNYVSHTGSDGSTSWQRMQRAGYVGRWGGENIYAGYNTTPAEAYTWWMNSTPHRENILGQYYRDVGVGYAYCSNGIYRNAYTINFGAP
jgi:uncharacterized protein YkwD